MKKISYANIPKEVLNMVIGESYGLGDYTLKDELDKYGEDIIAAQYTRTSDSGTIAWFRAWTKTYAMCLVDSMFGDRIILGLNREIPEELKYIDHENYKSLKEPYEDEFDFELVPPKKIIKVKAKIIEVKKINGRSKEKRKRIKRRTSKANK